MSELQPAARLFFWIAGIVLAFGMGGSLGRLRVRMARSAIEAKQQSQMFSELLRSKQGWNLERKILGDLHIQYGVSRTVDRPNRIGSRESNGLFQGRFDYPRKWWELS